VITLFDPRLWLAAIICIALSFFAGSWHGASEATDKARVAEAGRTASALAGLAKEKDATIADERKLRAADRTAFDKYVKEQDDDTAAKDRTIACLRAGTCVVRVPIRAPRKAPEDASGPATSGPREEGQAELTPDAGIFLVDLLARGDEGIRKHAEVVDRYERLRVACTSDSPTDVPNQGTTQ
jgi:hypothetical protein